MDFNRHQRKSIWAIPLVVTHCWLWGIDHREPVQNLNNGIPLHECFTKPKNKTRANKRKLQKDSTTKYLLKLHEEVQHESIRLPVMPDCRNDVQPFDSANNVDSINSTVSSPGPTEQEAGDPLALNYGSDWESKNSHSEYSEISPTSSVGDIENFLLSRRLEKDQVITDVLPGMEGSTDAQHKEKKRFGQSPGHQRVSLNLESLLFAPSTPVSAGAIEGCSFDESSISSDESDTVNLRSDDEARELFHSTKKTFEFGEQRRHTIGAIMTVADMISTELYEGHDPNDLSPNTRYRKVRKNLKPVSTRVNGVPTRLPFWDDDY